MTVACLIGGILQVRGQLLALDDIARRAGTPYRGWQHTHLDAHG
jgi:hypothetical protein